MLLVIKHRARARNRLFQYFLIFSSERQELSKLFRGRTDSCGIETVETETADYDDEHEHEHELI